MMIDVARDEVGLKLALGEMLERGFVQSRISRTLEASDEESGDRVFGSVPEPTLSPGYYKLGEYLMWLEPRARFFDGFAAFEADGLCALEEARKEFQRKHPPCGGCGAYQDSPFATSCHNCGMEFAKKGPR